MDIRILRLETHNAAENMAIDEAIYRAVDRGKSPPTIRFYKWKPSAISIGRNQNINTVNLEKIKNRNENNKSKIEDSTVDNKEKIKENKDERERRVDIVRRPTGGNLVYHDENDLTYSVIFPLNMFKDLRDAYKQICGWLINGLKKIGVDAEFYGNNDIVFSGKKIIGSAQHNTERTILQHGAIFFQPSKDKWMNYTNFDFFGNGDKIRDKMKDLAFIKNIKDITFKDLLDAISEEFVANNKITQKIDNKKNKIQERRLIEEGELTEEEKIEVERLVKEKYSNAIWNYGTGEEKKGDICAIDIRDD